MNNIIIINENIDVKPFLDEMDLDDWNWVSRQKGTGGNKNPYGFLPLVWAQVKAGEDPHDVDRTIKTPLFDKYQLVHEFWIDNNICEVGRAAFFRLKPGDMVNEHIDRGTYYQDKDRYHLSLQGEYLYKVGDEEMIVKPGTFFWFNNKLPHSAKNVGDVDRYTLVWDVPYSSVNPHHAVFTRGANIL